MNSGDGKGLGSRANRNQAMATKQSQKPSAIWQKVMWGFVLGWMFIAWMYSERVFVMT